MDDSYLKKFDTIVEVSRDAASGLRLLGPTSCCALCIGAVSLGQALTGPAAWTPIVSLAGIVGIALLGVVRHLRMLRAPPADANKDPDAKTTKYRRKSAAQP